MPAFLAANMPEYESSIAKQLLAAILSLDAVVK